MEPTGLKLGSARGGSSDENRNGGLGAKLSGNFALNQNSVLKIVVGQEGIKINTNHGGGGGSFVVKSPYNTLNSVLITAGGGGGAAGSPGGNGINASVGSSEPPGQSGGLGGTNGNGGNVESGNGGAGAGFLTDGGTNWQHTSGYSFLNGAKGGNNDDGSWGDGGFGGGGSGWGNTGHGGGGGGFSGGGTGGSSHLGGGGEFPHNSGTDQTNTAGANAGHGKVVITFLAPFYTFTNAGATGREGPTQSQIDILKLFREPILQIR